MSNYLMSDNVVYANHRFRAGRSTNTAAPTGVTVNFNSIFYDPDNAYDNTTGIWTCPADGEYRIDAQVRLDSMTAGNNLALEIRKNNIVEAQTFTVNDSSGRAVQPITTTLRLVKGNDIRITLNYGGATGTITGQLLYNWFSIERVPDYSAGQPVGFGVATESRPGLISSEGELTDITGQCSISAGSNVTSAGVLNYVRYYRIGKLITVSFQIASTTYTNNNTLSDIRLTLPTFLSRTSTTSGAFPGAQFQSTIQPRVRAGTILTDAGTGTNSWLIRGFADSTTTQSVQGTFTFHLDW